MGKTPKYFDYLHSHGPYLTDRFDIRCETDSLETDVARYRRRRSDQSTYWVSAVYIRRLLEQIVDGYLRSSPYEYGRMLGKKLHEGVEDGYIPRSVGYKMSTLNELVRDGAHATSEPYAASELEAALIQLDVVLRAILKSERKRISGDEVASGTDDVLLAHSDSIEEKGSQAAQLTGNEKLAEESRQANRRAIAAEREALEAREQVEQVAKENEQLKLELADAKQTIERQKAAISQKEAAYARNMGDGDSVGRLFARSNARLDAKAAELESSQAESDAKLAEARRNSSVKEAAAVKAADEVSELEERLDEILNEHDFINALLDAHGKATYEQRRIVNYPLNPKHKSRAIRVAGKAGTGKTLCLLAAVINYLEPNGQAALSYGGQTMARRALFVCYNKDLASYIRGLLARFPHLNGRIEVANYDQYLNQLVRTSPIEEYKYLSEYAKDVRFQPVYDSYGVRHYWNLIVNEEDKSNLIRQAIVGVQNYYQSNGMQEYCSSSYLDENNERNVSWLSDEIEWLEGRYHDIEEGQALYPGAERTGRGRGRSPRKNSAERTHVTNVWVEYCRILRSRQLYTFQQIVTTLLRSNSLPTYDIVAVDEAQDLNMLHVELFTRFMAEGGYLFIAGDEGQKLYPRDFSWREVDARIKPYSLSLSANKRNPAEVRHFAERLANDKPALSGAAFDMGSIVRISCEPKESTVAYVRELAGHSGETTVVVTNEIGAWESLLRAAGIVTETSKDYYASSETIRMDNGGVRPGVYCFSHFKVKGLEFDNVIIDYASEIDQQDERRERRIRYMQFTRARKTLLVRYDGEAPELLKKYYPDYLAQLPA